MFNGVAGSADRSVSSGILGGNWCDVKSDIWRRDHLRLLWLAVDYQASNGLRSVASSYQSVQLPFWRDISSKRRPKSPAIPD